jgi:hypothetical protein
MPTVVLLAAATDGKKKGSMTMVSATMLGRTAIPIGEYRGSSGGWELSSLVQVLTRVLLRPPISQVVAMVQNVLMRAKILCNCRKKNSYKIPQILI